MDSSVPSRSVSEPEPAQSVLPQTVVAGFVQDGVGPHLVVAAAAAALVHRYSEREDVPVLCGFGTGKVFLRLRVEGDCTFRALLSQTHHCAGTNVCAEDEAGALLLSVCQEAGEIRTSVAVPSSVAAPALHSQFASRLSIFLREAAAKPESRIDELSLLDPEERQSAFGAPPAADDRPELLRCVHEFFEDAVSRAPNAVAVTLGGERLTYDELNRWSAAVAWKLRRSGVGPDVLVGVCCERSLELLVAILGVLRAGGAYVPLDPGYPRERLAFIAGDAALKAIVCNRAASAVARDLARDDAQLVVVVEDVERALPDGLPDSTTRVAPENAAYVIYTSGSTGKPKGVVITHANVSRLMTRTEGLFSPGDRDVWTLFHSFAFDFSVWEIWGALAYGGRLVIVPNETARTPADFWHLLSSEGVTVLNQTPSAFSALIREMREQNLPDLPALRLVIFGGEALDFASLRPWVDRFGLEQPVLVNMYGITETTVHVTHHRIQESDIEAGRSLIGRPIDDLQVYILNRCLEPVPAGVPGEMHVSGAGLAREYLNRPELTAVRFVPNPFRPEERLYRSGDLGRLGPDGVIEYMGRIDEQVKIRGFRIELGEISALLSGYPGVGEARVIVREDSPGDKRLVAYLVAVQGGGAIDSAALRRHLAGLLPGYMIPAAFVWLDAFPLTLNGKLDRAALPLPQVSAAGDAEPSTELERTVADIAGRLLGIPAIGCDVDLFDLGLHSLVAGRLVAELRYRFARRVNIADVFEARTIRALAARIDRRGAAAFVEEQIPRLNHRDNIPLTWQQEQIWFLSKVAPDVRAYNSQILIRLEGRLDLEALRSSFDRIIERHEILRTTFHDTTDGPRQVVHPAWRAEVEFVDFSHLDPGASGKAFDDAIARAVLYVFDTTKLPLMKWMLCRMAEDRHVLLHLEHHLVHDGWEVALLLRELQEFYSAKVEGREPRVEELPVQYAEYAAWQRARLAGGTLDKKVSAWEERLSGYPQVLNLPTDRPRPRVQSFRGGAVERTMDSALYARLREYSRERKVTLFVTMCSAFAVLLERYTGQKKFLIGTGVANRSHRETQALLGMFVNVIALPMDLAGEPSFEDLLHSVQRVMIETAGDHDTPFIEVVRRLKAGLGHDRNPLIQALFAFHDSNVPVPAFAGLAGSVQEIHNGTAKMDMNLLCVPRAEQHVGSGAQSHNDLTLLWEYNQDLFDRRTIERMMDQYLHLLSEVVRSPGTSVFELDVVPETDRGRITGEFNAPSVAYGRDRTIWDLFEEAARAHPDKTAILDAGNRVSYAALTEAAGRIASSISASFDGALPAAGFAAGLAVPRSWKMIAGMLGILRAGGAYVPLPASYPPERLRLMLDDSGARVVLAEGCGLDAIQRAGETSCPVLDLDHILKSQGQTTLSPTATGETPAYVLYTSGSTGAPKGVVVPHRAVHNLMLSLRRDLVGPDDVVGQLGDEAFDATIFEIWGALLNGGTVAIICGTEATEPERLEQALVNNGVTAAWFTASLFHLIAEMRPQTVGSLRIAAVGGEKVDLRAIARVMEHAPGTLRFWHGYGPTECTCFSTGCWCTSENVEAGRLPIGRPLLNYSAYILDERRALVPVGVPGELYIGGDGLALGYLNRPELTRERFVANPFGPGLLYRTGDASRWLDNGEIEFLGRLDGQVKVRGYRVELGEVESALARHPAVGLAAATVRRARDGESEVIGWVSPAPGAALDSSDIRDSLSRSLPPFMIPGRIIVCDRLPLTPSGKIDRNSLSEPTGAASTPSAGDVLSPIGSQIAQIWAEMLETDAVDPHRDFFSLGGHSLLAVRMMSRVSELVGRNVPVATLFAAPTIAELSRVLAEQALPDISPPYSVQSGVHQPVFFFHGDWDGAGLYCRHLARQIDPERAFYALPPHGALGDPVPPTIEAMAADRFEAILALQPEGPFLLGGYCIGGLVALELGRLLEAAGCEVGVVFVIDSSADAHNEIPQQLLLRWKREWKYRISMFAGQWAASGWRGRAGLVSDSVKRRLTQNGPAAETGDGESDWSQGPAGDYLRAFRKYRLRPYAGRLCAIFGQGVKWVASPEPAWRKMAPEAEIHWVAGDHASVIGAHAADTAAIIRAAIERAGG